MKSIKKRIYKRNRFEYLKAQISRSTSVGLDGFYDMVEKVRPFWDKLPTSKQCHGRTSNLKSLEYEILLVLFYYRCYTSHFLLGMHFGHDVSNVCRYLKRMEPLMAEAIHIKKNRGYQLKI